MLIIKDLIISIFYYGGIMEVNVKKQVITLLQTLPDQITLDDIMRELYFKIQVDEGLKELDEGKGIPHEEVEKRFAKWISK